MQWFEALILGAVEGITEFLPISSTAHLMLAAEALGLSQTDFVKTFEIAVQCGAILAVAVLYWRSFINQETLTTLAVAFIPTGIVGFLLYPFIKQSLVGNITVALYALFFGGIALVFFEYWYKRRAPAADAPLTYGKALIIGLFQSVAVIPGVSRSAATILGGLMLGLSRTKIVEFSFLLAVPTMALATGYDILKNREFLMQSEFSLLMLGFLASFVVALLAVTFLLRFIRRHDFVPFGIYRIVLTVLFFLVFVW